MKKNIFYILAVLLLGTAGCEQQSVYKYENDPRLYFFNGVDYSQTPTLRQNDSIAQSFFILPEDQLQDTVWIVVETMGLVAEQPRPFTLVQTNVGETNAAVAGTHFMAFDSEEMKKNMMIPVGSVRYYMPLIVLRGDPLMETSVLRLKLKIVENAHFKVGIEKQTELLVKMTAMPERPSNWSSWTYTFGTWGPKKMWFLVHKMGITDFTFPDDYAYSTYLNSLFIEKLAEYNANPDNPDVPLTEANGTPVSYDYY